MKKSFPIPIRIMAAVLVITFFAQDVVLANPEIFENRQSTSTLQAPSFFQNVDPARILEVNLRRLLAYDYNPPAPKNLVLQDRGVRMELTLPPDAEGIISCATIVGDNRRLFKARVLPDRSIQLIPERPPSSGVQFSVVRVPYVHILLSAAPVEGDDLEAQVDSLLVNIDKALTARYCSRDSVVRQTIFLKNLSDKKRCQAIMESYYGRAPPPAISYVIQAPADGRLLSIEMTAIPEQSGVLVERIDRNIVIVKDSGIRWAFVAGLEPRADINDTYEQALDVFGQMERVLFNNGFKFENVLRTWIYQGRITGDDGDERQRYDKLNDARWKFFKTSRAGGEIKFGGDFLKRSLKDKIFPYPASTGISMNDGSFVMECLAVSTDRKDVEIVPIENPRQTPVYMYGEGVLQGKKVNPLFSRGMELLIGNTRIVFVSGTASIIGDENAGNSIEDQTAGAIENISLVLKEAGLSLRDVAQLRVYIRDSIDCDKVKNIVEEKFGKTPRLEMIAGVCRKELLVELEAVAYSKNPAPAERGDLIGQRNLLDYYLDPQNDILNAAVDIPGFQERDGEIEYAIFKRMVDTYKFKASRRFEKERKKLLANLFLPNILPPTEKRRPETAKQSESRSEICKKLLFDEILSDPDPGIFRPALGAIIEILARERGSSSTHFFDRFYPILEESGRLPRFAEALIDTLISVEHHKERLFYISDDNEFFDETKLIIRDMASRLPSMRRHIISYLFAILKKSVTEIPLARRLLNDLGFYMVSPKEFDRFSALKTAQEILTLQKVRPDKPVVLLLAGGSTMLGFFDELANMPEIDWQRVEIFQHSEYRGKGSGSDYSIANIIEEHLVKKVYAPSDRKHVHYIGADPDLLGYIKELDRLGGADILTLGVGSNGHIGYIEPSKALEENGAGLLKLVELSESTVQNIVKYYPDITKDPYAYTMSLAGLMKARRIFLFANGPRKAQIVKDAFANSLMPGVPVSEVLEHTNVSVVLDSEAVKGLTENAFDEYVKIGYALRKSEDNLNALIKNNLTPSHKIDREGTIMWVSDEEADMLGYSPAEMIGRPIWEFIAPEDQEPSRIAINKKVSHPQELPSFERKYRHSDGTYIWVYIEERQVIDSAGKVTGVLSRMVNISEAKLWREALEAEERDLEERLKNPAQNGVIRIKQEFVLPAGCKIERRHYDAKLADEYIYPVIEIKLNGQKYNVGGNEFLIITLPGGKRIYWSGQHNLSYSFFFDHYRAEAIRLINKGGVRWAHIDAHTDMERDAALPERLLYMDPHLAAVFNAQLVCDLAAKAKNIPTGEAASKEGQDRQKKILEQTDQAVSLTAAVKKVNELLWEWNFTIYRLLHRRSALKAEGRGTGQVLRSLDSVIGKMKAARPLLEKVLSVRSIEKIDDAIKQLERTRPAGQDEKGINVRIPNEPAANMELVSIIVTEMADLKTAAIERRAKNEADQKRIFFDKGRWSVRERRYRYSEDWGTSTLRYGFQSYGTLWEAFRALDHQIDTELAEKAYLADCIELLMDMRAGSPADSKTVRDRIDSLLSRLKKVRVEEKRLARIVLESAKTLTGLKRNEQASGLLNIASGLFAKRIAEVDSISERLGNGRSALLKSEVERKNSYLLHKTNKILRDLKAGHSTLTAMIVSEDLLGTGAHYLKEPDFSPFRKSLELIDERFKRGPPPNDNIGQFRRFFRLFHKRVIESLATDNFMTAYRNEFLRLCRQKGADVATARKTAFNSEFEKFAISDKNVRNDRRLYYKIFNQAAFIPPILTTDKGRVPNPEFWKISYEILRSDAEQIGLRPEGIRFLMGGVISEPETAESLEDIKSKANELKGVLDARLNSEEAGKIIARYLNTYSYRSLPIVGSLRGLLDYGLPKVIAEFFGSHKIWDKTKQSNILETTRAFYAAQSDVPPQPASRQAQIIRFAEETEAKGSTMAFHAIRDLPPKSVIFIAGPTCSGKTIFTENLDKLMGRKSLVHLELDNYYKDHRDIPRDEFGKLDFDSPQSLDLELIMEHIRALLDGKAIETPRFDMANGRRTPETTTLRLESGQRLVVEGTLAFRKEIAGHIDERHKKFFIFIFTKPEINIDSNAALPSYDIRLMRRIVRDARTRGIKAIDTIRQWASVKRSENRYMEEEYRAADLLIDTSLPYEFPVIKSCIMPLLEDAKVTAKGENDFSSIGTIARLEQLLKDVPAADSKNVPPDSILWEFITPEGQDVLSEADLRTIATLASLTHASNKLTNTTNLFSVALMSVELIEESLLEVRALDASTLKNVKDVLGQVRHFENGLRIFLAEVGGAVRDSSLSHAKAVSWKENFIGLVNEFSALIKSIKESEVLYGVKVEKVDNELLDIIDISLEKIDLLLSDRLMYMAGKRSDQVQDVSSLVKEAVSFFDKEGTVKLSTILHKDDMKVMGSRITLVSTLINLMNNGIKAAKAYHDEYGGEANIKVEVTEDKGDVVISIIDNGPGITAEKLKDMNKPFFTTGGGGIGLTESRLAVKDNGGVLSFVSEVGKGTTAQVRLPMIRNYPANALSEGLSGAKAYINPLSKKQASVAMLAAISSLFIFAPSAFAGTGMMVTMVGLGLFAVILMISFILVMVIPVIYLLKMNMRFKKIPENKIRTSEEKYPGKGARRSGFVIVGTLAVNAAVALAIMFYLQFGIVAAVLPITIFAAFRIKARREKLKSNSPSSVSGRAREASGILPSDTSQKTKTLTDADLSQEEAIGILRNDNLRSSFQQFRISLYLSAFQRFLPQDTTDYLYRIKSSRGIAQEANLFGRALNVLEKKTSISWGDFLIIRELLRDKGPCVKAAAISALANKENWLALWLLKEELEFLKNKPGEIKAIGDEISSEKDIRLAKLRISTDNIDSYGRHLLAVAIFHVLSEAEGKLKRNRLFRFMPADVLIRLNENILRKIDKNEMIAKSVHYQYHNQDTVLHWMACICDYGIQAILAMMLLLTIHITEGQIIRFKRKFFGSGKILSDIKTPSTELSRGDREKIGILFTNDRHIKQAKAERWLLERLRMAGLDPLRYHAKSAPQWAQFTHKEFRLKEVEDKELLRVLSEAGYIRGGCHKDRAEWTISQRKDLRLDRLSLSKAQKLYAERLFLSCCGEEYVQSVILPMAGPVRSVALTGGQYDICLKAIFEYLAKQQENPSAQPLYVLVYEPAIYLGFGIKRKVRADYLDILRQHIVPQAVYIDGQERRNLSSTEPARLVVDIYTNRKAFEKYFQAQWKEKAKKSGLLVSTGGSEALSRSIPEASHAEPALATIAQSANPADPAVAKALEVFNYVNAGISGIDVEIENVIDKLRKSGFTLDDTKARLVNTALREAYYVVDKIEFLPPGQLSSADGIGLVADRDGVGPSLEEMSRKENGLVYVMTRDDKVIDHDYSGDMWIHSNGGDNSALFLVDLNKKTIEPISVGKKVRIITARAAAESWVKEFKPATNPTKFLRNIVDTKELTQNMIEGILSALFSNKKLTLAFSKKLKGLESAQLRSLVRQLNEWKESTARKNKRMKALMNHFTILEYDNLKIALHEYDIDANARDGLIFAYAPKPKDVSGDMANMGSAVKPVYIIEESDGFPADYYYPLLEMVTVSLAKELLQWDESQLREALAASNITAISLGIDTDIDEKLGILIFKVLPKMRRYDNNSRIDRYTRLMQFLRSA